MTFNIALDLFGINISVHLYISAAVYATVEISPNVYAVCAIASAKKIAANTYSVAAVASACKRAFNIYPVAGIATARNISANIDAANAMNTFCVAFYFKKTFWKPFNSLMGRRALPVRQVM